MWLNMERFALFERCFIAVKVLKQSNILKAMLVDFVVNILAPKIEELFDVRHNKLCIPC